MKTIISLLFILVSFKALSQDSLKTNINNYAIVELKKLRQDDFETATIYYDNGKTEDMTGKLYKNTEPNINLIPQKSLLFIKYMAEKHYYLISSTATSGDAPNTYGSLRHYQYQYFFEKRDK